MNTTKQFWALFKFQQSVNPFLILMPVIFAIPYVTTYFLDLGKDNYHPSLSLLLSNPTFYLIGILAVMWLAPEILRKGGANGLWTGGAEFMLTRAVDRRIVARSRLVFFYFIVLLVPLAVVCFSLGKPALTISEYDSTVRQQILQDVPGSTMAPKDESKRSEAITISSGEILVSTWRLWLFLASAVVVQALIYLVYPWKYRRAVVWTLYIVIIFLPMLQIISGFGRGHLTLSETSFFSYATHWPWFWAAGFVALVVGQVWSERRFAAMEQV